MNCVFKCLATFVTNRLLLLPMEQQSIKFDVDVVAKNTHQTQTKPSVFFFISLQFLYLLHRMFTDTHGTTLTLCLQSIWRNRVCLNGKNRIKHLQQKNDITNKSNWSSRNNRSYCAKGWNIYWYVNRLYAVFFSLSLSCCFDSRRTRLIDELSKSIFTLFVFSRIQINKSNTSEQTRAPMYINVAYFNVFNFPSNFYHSSKSMLN